jgi:sialic acid synthase SpsE
MAEIKIGEYDINKDNCFIIAEAGSNHDNDFEKAKRLIDAAAEAGVDAIKFQTFKADKHYSKKTPKFEYLDEKPYELIKKLELNREWQKGLKEYCNKKGLYFLSSPCDKEAIDQLDEIGVKAFKLSSFDMVDLDLLEYMAKKGKPVIVSTGLADYEDVFDVVKVMKKVGNDQLIFLQCTSLYPAPPELSNLASMEVIEKMFGYPTGYSDHTLGIHIPTAAAALGAVVIEKHFTLNKEDEGPDHKFAIEPDELKELVTGVRETKKAIGNGYKLGPRKEEMDMYEKGRRSIMAAKDLKAGTKITEENIVNKRPGYGIKPKYKKFIIGKKINTDLEEDSWITWDMIG